MKHTFWVVMGLLFIVPLHAMEEDPEIAGLVSLEVPVTSVGGHSPRPSPRPGSRPASRPTSAFHAYHSNNHSPEASPEFFSGGHHSHRPSPAPSHHSHHSHHSGRPSPAFSVHSDRTASPENPLPMSTNVGDWLRWAWGNIRQEHSWQSTFFVAFVVAVVWKVDLRTVKEKTAAAKEKAKACYHAIAGYVKNQEPVMVRKDEEDTVKKEMHIASVKE